MSSEFLSDKQIKPEDTCKKNWHLNRQITLSVIIQLVLLASLILGSWVNLQRQLDLLQKDVSTLIECQKKFEQKLELISAKNFAFEYRIRAIEKQLPQANISH